MSMADRAAHFHTVFPNYAKLTVHNDNLYGSWGNENDGQQITKESTEVDGLVLHGTWIIGSLFGYKTVYYGAYPYKVKERILALFPDMAASDILHLCSGIIHDQGVDTYDIKKELKPTICDDVRNIKKHADVFARKRLVVADPPYEARDFEKYGVSPPFNKQKVVHELGEIMQSGSFLTWLDVIVPIYNKKVWALRGHIGMVISTNTRARMLTIWERV
jgi:hypothetical protein